MGGSGFLRDVAVILAASFPVLFLCRKLRLPQVVGFLLTGVVIGPHALGWVGDTARVSGIAALGMVLILFFVGLQFPLERLLKLGKTALIGGPLQMLLTTGAIAFASLPMSPYAFGVPGLAEKSSISSLSRKPAPSTVTHEP